VARHLEDCGVEAFGVALLEEGLTLREAGITRPILVFGGIPVAQMPALLRHQLELTAPSVAKLEQINAAAAATGLRARVHLKIDTGMGRIGVQYFNADTLLEASLRCRHVEVAGVYSHFANIANSAALLQLPESHLDLVRPGIVLYGVAPGPECPLHLPLQPVLTWRSRVVYFKVLPADHPVGYGSAWRSDRPERLVTVPCGYGDGYPRALSNRAEVLIRGRRCPIAGKICMDQFMASLGDGSAYNGDEVVLVGRQEGECIRVEEVAERAGTIPYEILTGIGARVPRVYA